MIHDADDDERLDARELPDESDRDDVDDPTVDCPHCGKAMYDEADVCPHCGNFITLEDAARPNRRAPLWIMVGVVACLAVVLLVWIRRG
jgi:hypothetical protein